MFPTGIEPIFTAGEGCRPIPDLDEGNMSNQHLIFLYTLEEIDLRVLHNPTNPFVHAHQLT